MMCWRKPRHKDASTDPRVLYLVDSLFPAMPDLIATVQAEPLYPQGPIRYLFQYFLKMSNETRPTLMFVKSILVDVLVAEKHRVGKPLNSDNV